VDAAEAAVLAASSSSSSSGLDGAPFALASAAGGDTTIIQALQRYTTALQALPVVLGACPLTAALSDALSHPAHCSQIHYTLLPHLLPLSRCDLRHLPQRRAAAAARRLPRLSHRSRALLPRHTSTLPRARLLPASPQAAVCAVAAPQRLSRQQAFPPHHLPAPNCQVAQVQPPRRRARAHHKRTTL